MARRLAGLEVRTIHDREGRMATRESSIGRLLREWRRARRMSQLALALEAHVSARHVSFVESGRSKPTREMVLRLAEVLDVPLRERNLMLNAAGFTSHFSETGLSEPHMAPVIRALDWMLERQEPHPAVVMDRHWNILRTNQAAADLFGRLIDLSSVPAPVNVLRLMFDPERVRPYVANWDEVAPALLRRLDRETLGGAPDTVLRALREELLAFPDVRTVAAGSGLATPLLPVIPVRFRKGALARDYFSTLTTLGTPHDVTCQEIRIECFFPAA
jgi:transcriptional regulator with XRE-family HTH domain